MIYPKDSNSRIVATEARKLFPNHLNSKYWEHHEQTGSDHGTDMVIEFIEHNEFNNNKIECQIKGTEHIELYSKRNYISYPLDVKTINYGLNCNNAFVLILVDTSNDVVYFVVLQDFFMKHKDLLKKMLKNKTTFSVQISYDDILTKDDDTKLRQIAKETYKRINEEEIVKI